MIDHMFRNINRLFVQSFKVGENDPTRNYFFKALHTLSIKQGFQCINWQ